MGIMPEQEVDEHLHGLLVLADFKYKQGGLSFLEGWTNIFRGTPDYDAVNRIYELVLERNSSPATSLFSLMGIEEKLKALTEGRIF